MRKLNHGDFTGLAENYSKYRPGYSRDVLNAILNYVGKPVADIDFADVGAGTGIWSRLVASQNPNQTVCIEPNADMRLQGEKDSRGLGISWIEGSGECTNLASDSVDLVTMASSFHWVEYEKGMAEFLRVLKPQGCFAALWNPRMLEANPLLVEIENKLREFAPNLKRVSSGNSGITSSLTQKLLHQKGYSEPTYIESYHTVRQTQEQYLGVWWSVNDIRSQAGEENFSRFMGYVEERIAGLEYIETTYKTRAWLVRKL